MLIADGRGGDEGEGTKLSPSGLEDDDELLCGWVGSAVRMGDMGENVPLPKASCYARSKLAIQIWGITGVEATGEAAGVGKMAQQGGKR